MKETIRQFIHLIFGLGVAYLLLLADRDLSVMILALSIFVGLVISDAVQRGIVVPLFSPMLDRFEREGAMPGKGALYFAVSALLCLVVFETLVVFISILVLSLLDSVATIAGRRFGRTKILNGKSVEGSLIATGATWAVLLLYLPPGPALLASVTGGVIELLSPVDDNLLIPVGVCLVLTLLPALAGI